MGSRKRTPGCGGSGPRGVESQPEEAGATSVATDCYRFISAEQFAGGRAVTGDSRRSESAEAEATELGFEVLLFAELFHDPRIALATDRHATLRKRQRRIVAPQM